MGEAETLARALDDQVRLVQVLALMAPTLNMTGDPDGAIATGRQALELAAALGESALQGEASLTWGRYTISSATSAGRLSCCGERGGCGPGVGYAQYRRADPVSGVAGADLERARSVR